jgi:hypothetical protein
MPDPSVSPALVSANSLASLPVAVAATISVCNGMQYAINFNPKWLALLVAQALMIALVINATDAGAMDYLLGILNGFVVYTSAVGATAAVAANKAGSQIKPQSDYTGDLPYERRGFWTPYLPTLPSLGIRSGR